MKKRVLMIMLAAVMAFGLVAESFCDKPDTAELLQIHHIDFDKRNNFYTNLEYLSPEEHAKKHAIHNTEMLGE